MFRAEVFEGDSTSLREPLPQSGLRQGTIHISQHTTVFVVLSFASGCVPRKRQAVHLVSQRSDTKVQIGLANLAKFGKAA